MGGAVSGAVGGAVGGFIDGVGMSAFNGSSFSEALTNGLSGAFMGALGGGVLGGVSGGINAKMNGKGFWFGEDIPKAMPNPTQQNNLTSSQVEGKQIGSIDAPRGNSVADDMIKSNSKRLTEGYPPNGGFDGAIDDTYLMPGDVVDRFGGTSKQSIYLSPINTPIEMRSLPSHRSYYT